MRRKVRLATGRGVGRGAAMVEFVLMLPIMMFIVAFAIYLAGGLERKETTQVRVRHRLWRQADLHWWWWGTNDPHSWSAWDGNANGSIGSGANNDPERPRGFGDELEDLYRDAGQAAHRFSGNAGADDYFRRLWNNLPGRHHRASEIWYDTRSRVFRFLNGPVRTDYYNDSVTWTHGQEPPWLIAMYGPMSVIQNQFYTHLNDVPPEFRRMREEVFHAWFKEEYMDNWNHWQGAMP